MRISLLHDLRFAIALSVIVSVLDNNVARRGAVWGDWLAFLLFAFYGIYCVQNFLSCREVHCSITGPGFVSAALLVLLRLSGYGHYETWLPWNVFVLSWVVGLVAEYFYEKRTGTVFMRR
jgi:hypothetical protein